MIQQYTQTTYETCLTCCLLQAVDQIKPLKINQQLELNCINHSMKFSKDDFVIGHLDFISKNFEVPIKRIVDNKKYYEYIKRIRSTKYIATEVSKISLKLINELLDQKPILYIDAYYLFKLYHYPHFIIVLEKVGTKYNIYDTWDGQEKWIESILLSKAISSLRNHIKLCPQILLVG